MFQGHLLSYVIIGCVDHKVCNGLYAKNPFNFKNNKISKFSLQVDSQDKSLKPIVCKFASRLISETCMNLMSGSRKVFINKDGDTSRENFSLEFAPFCFLI